MSKYVAAVTKAIRKGFTIDQIAKQLNVSASTIDRTVRRIKRKNTELKLIRGRPTKKRTIVAKYPICKSTIIDIGYVNKVCDFLLKEPFPFPQFDNVLFEKDIRRLIRINMRLHKNEIQPWVHYGARACLSFFPNRYSATYKSETSALVGWRDPNIIARAVNFQLAHGDPVTPDRVLRAVTLLCRTPTIFKPSIAKFIYERFASPGDTVWDPCAGYGGRLLGAHVAGVNYIGTDVEEETVEGNRQLNEALGARHEVVLSPAESFDPPKVDLVFTSPPYFDCERYSQNGKQSYKQHGASFEGWIDGFLRPVIRRAKAALGGGGQGFLILNVADIRNKRSAVVPIIDRTITTALEIGFRHVVTLQMPLAAINRNRPSEPVLIFQ